MKLTLVHLYHDLMNVYGDRGNIIVLERRCAWRGIELEVRGCTLDEEFDPTATDLIFFGGGQDREQSVVAHDLVERKGAAIRAAVDAGTALLAVCGGFQLLGHGFRLGNGEELPGVGLFDAHTVAGKRRYIGNIVISCDWASDQPTLVGFENHSGRTFLGPNARPLGRVLQGHGNNGEDHGEGAIYRNAYGCYLHGSLLPKNPWFADLLIAAAFEHRSQSKANLTRLDDRLERLAHDSVVSRASQLGQQRSGVH